MTLQRSDARPPPASRRSQERLDTLKAWAVPGGIAVIVAWLAYHRGTYGLSSRSALAIVLWWAIVVTAGLSLAVFTRPTRATLVAVGSLAGLAMLSLASMAWGDGAERAFLEFNRVTLYLAVVLGASLLASRTSVARIADGLAVAITFTALFALGSRLLPDVVPTAEAFRLLPARTRLAYPIGYWNGLAAFLALGVPLLLRIATTARSNVVRGLAVAPLPAFAAVLYLTSSRGGILAAAVAVLAFIMLTPRRLAVASALAVAGAASAVVVAALLARRELANGPLGTNLVERQGRDAALVVLAASLAAATAYAVGSHVIRPRIASTRTSERAVVVGAFAIAAAAVLALHPVARLREFQSVPNIAGTSPDYVREHLLSASGNGRWQMWGQALDAFRAHPALGGGAGSFQTWWAQHRPIPLFVLDAHSLYVETLGELGVLGLALVLVLVSVGIGAGIARVREASNEHAVTLAALTAALAAFAFAAAGEWLWELTAVSVVAFVILGLLTGSLDVGLEGSRPAVLALRGAVVVVGVAIIAAQAIPMLRQVQLQASEDAARRGDVTSAVRHAKAARRLEPWSPAPYLQLALLDEDAGEPQAARRSIREAVERDASNWQLWLIRARIETKTGAIEAARVSLRRAKRLNPFWARSLPPGRAG